MVVVDYRAAELLALAAAADRKVAADDRAAAAADRKVAAADRAATEQLMLAAYETAVNAEQLERRLADAEQMIAALSVVTHPTNSEIVAPCAILRKPTSYNQQQAWWRGRVAAIAAANKKRIEREQEMRKH